MCSLNQRTDPITDQTVNLIVDSVQDITEQTRIFLQKKYQNTREENIGLDPIIWVSIPLCINFIIKPQNEIIYSVELVKQFILDLEEVNEIKLFATETSLTLQEAMLEIIRIAINKNPKMHQMRQSYPSKFQLAIEVNLVGKFTWENH